MIIYDLVPLILVLHLAILFQHLDCLLVQVDGTFLDYVADAP